MNEQLRQRYKDELVKHFLDINDNNLEDGVEAREFIRAGLAGATEFFVVVISAALRGGFLPPAAVDALLEAVKQDIAENQKLPVGAEVDDE